MTAGAARKADDDERAGMSVLDGKIAVVTGSDSGIGQAIAEEFAIAGADVMIVYLHDRDGAEETRCRVEGASRRAAVVQADIRDPARVAALFDEAERALGVPDILVNNAGIGSGGAPVAETSDD